MKLRASLSEADTKRFEKQIVRGPDCWLWQGGKGSPQLWVGDGRISAASASFFLHYKRWPAHKLYHHCHNIRCVNPEHLYETVEPSPNDLGQLFWRHVQPAADDACWPWMQGCDDFGYGKVRYNSRSITAHRVAFFLSKGHWPKVACHECDNPICCNPKHIVDGTYALNVQHCKERGRMRPCKGNSHGQAKLKEADVRKIRDFYAQGVPQSAIARHFGVTQTNVSCIITGKSWSHLV